MAIQHKPDYAPAHALLGIALIDKGDLEAAIIELRRAIELTPDDFRHHFAIGNALRDNGQLDDAITAYNEAIRFKPDYPEAHCNLGHVLRRQGKFRDSVAVLRRGHQLASKNPNWPYPSAKWVAEVERLVELDDRLAAAMNGEANPGGAAEQIELAWFCLYYKHQNRAAARFYGEAFAAQPDLAGDLTKEHRYNAACAAALAGCGQGEDAGSIGDEERARLRQQALDWLRADLESWRTLPGGDSADGRAKVIATLKHWQQDKDLASVRDAEALAKLPEADREAWGTLWGEVGRLLGVKD